MLYCVTDKEFMTFLFCFFMLFPFGFFFVLGGIHCDIYKYSYSESNISYLNSPLHHSPLSFSPLIPGIVSTGINFPFTYMCTQYLHHIHPPMPLPYLLPPPTGTNPPTRIHSTLLSSNFVPEKK
jgi:hypothetical protein